VHPLQGLARLEGPAGQHAVASRGQLVQALLEPQLADLVHRDEQQLVVRVGPELLLVQQLREVQVAAVGQASALLAELDVAHGRRA
jgi:hypothetical protein